MNNVVAMDQNHAEFIYGCLVAQKPHRVIEMGVGVGVVTRYLIKGIKYNETGRLLCVDNWLDTGGNEPEFFAELRPDLDFLLATEEEFVSSSPANIYDFLVFDADHGATDKRIDKILEIAKPGAFLFFHDVNTPDFPNLGNITKKVKELGLDHYVFTKSTRTDERCERGLLFVIK